MVVKTYVRLDDENTFSCDMTLEQARGLEITEELEFALDQAQGYVFQDKGKVSYVVIKITKYG